MKVLDSQPMLVRFWVWFYGDAILIIYQIVTTYCLKIFDIFSIPILARTLLDPWKRDIISTKKMSLDMRIQAFFWNIFSRIIGFFIRLVVLIFGLLILVIIFVLGILLLLIWILFPLITIYLIWYSFYLFTI